MPDEQPEWVLQRRRAIGTRIRDARISRDLTQDALAERCALDRKTINRIERGTSDPPLSDLLRIAAALDTPIADLVTD